MVWLLVTEARGVIAEDLAAFCEEQWPRLVGALSLYTGDPDLAEDLAQDAVVRLCRHWRRVRVMDSPVGWLHRVARNLAHSYFRRLRARTRAENRAAKRVRVEGEADVVAIRVAVAALPERERDAIVLRFYVGLSVRDTAEALGCPEGTVKTLTHRAVGRLREGGVVGEEVLDG
jgi:RNA polymerase sigma-70 factor (ECF subfamily)